MGTISTRVPEDLEAELEEYVDNENLDRSTAVRKLLTEGLAEWRREYALERLEAGEATLSRAAELAGVSIWEMKSLAHEHDVVWVDEEYTADDLDAL